MRPRFDVDVDVSIETVFRALKTRADEAGFPLHLGGMHADLRVPMEHEHLFSPTLQIQGIAVEQKRLQCRFSPHPNVWTGFMASYLALACAGTAGLMYGMSQWVLGQAPWALIAVPGAGALIAVVYGAAFIGQGLGSGQMYELRALLDLAVADASDVTRTSPSAAGSHS